MIAECPDCSAVYSGGEYRYAVLLLRGDDADRIQIFDDGVDPVALLSADMTDSGDLCGGCGKGREGGNSERLI